MSKKEKGHEKPESKASTSSWWSDFYDAEETGGDWKFWSGVGKKEKGRSHSSFWSSRFYDDYSYSAWGGDADTRRREQFNEILKSVRRSANVVGTVKNKDGTERNLTVRWSGGEQVNDVKSNVVYLSPEVVDNPPSHVLGWSSDEKTDVLIAEALAEATQKRTMDADIEKSMVDSVKDPAKPQFERNVLCHHLWKTTEQLHAEKEVTSEYPGFAGYFASYRDYYTDPNTLDRINRMIEMNENAGVALQALQWELLHPDEHVTASPKLQDALKYAFTELAKAKSSPDRAACARKVVDDFMTRWHQDRAPGGKGKGSTPNGGGTGNPFDDIHDDGFGPYLKAAMDPEKRDYHRPGVPRKMRGSEVKGDAEVSDPDEGEAGIGGTGSLDEHATFKAGTLHVKVKAGSPTSTSRRSGSTHSYEQLIKAYHPKIAALRAQLKLRNEEQRHIEHGLRRGRVDEGSLYKLGMGDDTVDPAMFEAEEILAPPKIALAILVDESGSMGSEILERKPDGKSSASDPYGGYVYKMDTDLNCNTSRIHEARKTAIILSEGVRGVPGLEINVLGHTAQGSYYGSSRGTEKVVIHHYNTPENRQPAAMAHMSAYCENLDGYAIGQVALKMKEWYGDEYQKVVIHISDGEPCGSGYGGGSALAHVGMVCRESMRQGVRVYGIGIEEAFSHDHGMRMYGKGNFLILKDAGAFLPIARFLRDVALRRRDAE